MEYITTEISKIFKVLSNPVRIKIIYALKNGELCICELLELLNEKQPVISKHIKELKNADIIKTKREGNKILCSIKDPDIFDLLDGVKKIIKKNLKEKYKEIK